MITGPVDHTSRVDVTAHVARRVAHIDDLRRDVIDLDVGDIVMRIRGGDGVDGLRNLGRHLPRSCGGVGHVPDAFFTGIM